MGVPIYCCSRNKKEEEIIGESIILNDNIHNICNIQLNNTNKTGTLNSKYKQFIKRKNDNTQNQTVLSSLSKNALLILK